MFFFSFANAFFIYEKKFVGLLARNTLKKWKGDLIVILADPKTSTGAHLMFGDGEVIHSHFIMGAITYP